MSRVMLSIVPRLRPAVCGTSTFGWRVGENWPDRDCRFVHLVVDGAAASREHYGSEDIHENRESARTLAETMNRFPDADAIVHYSSCGFHRWGCPLWLPRALARWRRRGKLTVFFHEVPMRLPWTSRYFLPQQVNGWIIRRLVRLADTVITNARDHAQRLEQRTGLARVPWVPVPSNIPVVDFSPEPAPPRSAGDFVIFGIPMTRLMTVDQFHTELPQWHRAGVLRRVLLIGPDDRKFSARLREKLAAILPAEAAVHLGELPGAEISRCLQSAAFCLSQSTGENYSKSGTFAAFAAHGCPVVMKTGPIDATSPLHRTIRPEEVGALSADELGRRARSLRAWYESEVAWPRLAARLHALHHAA